MRWMISIFFICASCQSKPVKTAEPVVGDIKIPIECVIAHGPRPQTEMEDTFLLNPKIQACLKSAPEIRDEKFFVAVSGMITPTGDVDKVFVDAPSDALKSCLSREIEALKMNRGRTGPFKLQIATAQTPSPGKSRAILLDLSTVKKFE